MAVENSRYYDDGKLLDKKYYLNGKLEGEYKSWHHNGQLMEQEFYRNGKRDGERKIWYNNGNLRVQTFYRNNLPQGIYKSWYRDGGRPYWFHWCKNGDAIDYEFTFRKKRIWMKLKRILDRSVHDKHADILSIFIISDLLNLA